MLYTQIYKNQIINPYSFFFMALGKNTPKEHLDRLSLNPGYACCHKCFEFIGEIALFCLKNTISLYLFTMSGSYSYSGHILTW